MSEDRELAAALAGFAQQRRQEMAHVPAEDLEAFYAGDLDAEHAEVVREHLAVCPGCVSLFRELDAFPAALSTDEGQAGDTDAALAATLSRVAAAGGGPRAQEKRRPPTLWRRFQGRRVLLAGLAALLALMTGLGWAALQAGRRSSMLEKRVARLQAELERTIQARERLAQDLGQTQSKLSTAQERLAASSAIEEAWHRPHVNTPIEQLRATQMRGPAKDLSRVRLPVAADFITLVLEDPQDESFPSYRLELRGPGGKVIGGTEGLERTPYRSFVVTLPRQILSAGRLGIRLYGVQHDKAKEIGAYEVEILP